MRFICLLVLSLVAACATVPSPQETAERVVWSPPQVIAASSDVAGQPLSDPWVAVDQKGAINVVWWAKGFGDIYFSRSIDGGKTFSKALNLSNTPLNSDHPVVAVDPTGGTYSVWEDWSIVPFSPEILFTRSTDGGTTWAPPQNISKTTRGISFRPNIAVDMTGAISVIWLEGGGHVFFTRSTDGGATWAPPQNISGDHVATGVSTPAIAVDQKGRLYIAWSANNEPPVLALSTDGGKTFSLPTPITQGRPTVSPNLSVDERGGLHVVWADGSTGTTEVLYARSTDGGATFTLPMNISQSHEDASVRPSVGVDRKGVISVVWNEFLPRHPEVFMARSTDGGMTFSPPLNMSQTPGPGDTTFPRMAVGPSGEVAVVWGHGVKEAIQFSLLELVPVPLTKRPPTALKGAKE